MAISVRFIVTVSAISDLVRHAGAVMTEREGHAVPAHYGSPAGELAVCVRQVGLSLRSDLGLLSIRATPTVLDGILDRFLGTGLACGGAALGGAAWWCRPPIGDEVVVVAGRATNARLTLALCQGLSRTPAQLDDRSDEIAIISVVGQRAPSVLETLGVFGDPLGPRATTPFCTASISGRAVNWLLQTDSCSLALVETAHAAATWRAIYEAGRTHGISCVGIEATERYSLIGAHGRTRGGP